MMQTFDVTQKEAGQGRIVCPKCQKIGVAQYDVKKKGIADNPLNTHKSLASVTHVYALDVETLDHKILEECIIK